MLAPSRGERGRPAQVVAPIPVSLFGTVSPVLWIKAGHVSGRSKGSPSNGDFDEADALL